MKITIIIPTFNGGDLWRRAARNVADKKNSSTNVIVIDSQSKDKSASIAEEMSFSVVRIPSSEFNHGGTRNLGVEYSDAEIVIFLTQDAVPCDDFIEQIASTFNDEKVAISFGRQLPHLDANPLAEHARYFNYKDKSYTASLEQKDSLGIKTVFTSNSFSAYRKSVFMKVGGFPSNTILSEDMYLAAKVVKAGYKIRYCAEAQVHHSHNYTPIEEFKRYFDIGVFHCDEPWIRESFGGAGGEGKKFIISELKYLVKNAPLWIPRACISNLAKIIGYKLGQNYKRLPLQWRKKLSMHKRYWDSISN